MENQEIETGDELVFEDNESSDDLVPKTVLQEQLAKKAAWREKAQKLSEENKRLQEMLNRPALQEKPVADEDIKETVKRLSLAEEKRQFGFKHGFSPEETDEVFAYAAGKGSKPDEVRENPFVKAAIESLRSQRRAEAATPSPSSSLPSVEGKSWSEMTPEERRKNFNKVFKQ